MIEPIETPPEWISRQTKCNACVYNENLSCCHMECFPADRLDKKNVYFVEVSDEEELQ